MLKQLFSFLILCTAYSFMLLHNIIPHHHYETARDNTSECEQLDPSTHSGHDCGHMFSHHEHSEDAFPPSTKKNGANILSKYFISNIASFTTTDPFSFFPDTEEIVYRDYGERIFVEQHCFSTGFRAPPMA